MSKMIDRADEDLTNSRAPWNLPDEEPEEYFVDVSSCLKLPEVL